MGYRSFSEKLTDAVNIVFLTLIALAMLFPFYYIIVVSFASYKEFLQTNFLLWPKHWVLDSYRFILSSKEFNRAIFVSSYITVIGTIVSLLLTAMMAYSLARNILGQRYYMLMVLFTFVFSGGMIPSYLVVKYTGLLNTFWALIIPGAISSFTLIVLRQFILGLPSELQEAAIIDGANDLQIFTRIILPLSKPPLAAFGLFTAVGLWNTYFAALLYLTDPAKWTIQVILRQIVLLDEADQVLSAARQIVVENPPPPITIGMAAIFLATLPILLVYPFLQKHFAKGVMLGAVKG